METQLGRGERVETAPDGAASLDLKFYDTQVDNLDQMTDAVALAIAEEGEVLMKNNGVLPLAESSNVTPFGYRYLNPVYGGTGSGNVNTDSPRIVSAQSALAAHFSVNSDMERVLSGASPRALNAEGFAKANESGGFEGAGTTIIEYPGDTYNGHESSCSDTVGIVFIGRIGGEGSDVTANVEGSTIYGTGYSDGTAHQLALSQDEKDMLRFAKANCSSVVVILNTANVMEIRDLVEDGGKLSADAILWVGDPGAQGFQAMGNILSGQVNPSGKTVDIWMTDLMENPVMYNFGNYEYDNTYLVAGGFPNPVGDQTEMNFLEYEENVYVGYRYYETADDTGATFTVFGQSGRSYDDAVVYSQTQLQAFADQLSEEGLMARIIVRSIAGGDLFEILAGHNRTNAACLAGWQSIPAEIVDADDARAVVIATSTNLIQRQNLSIIERGKAYRALLDAKNRNGQRNVAAETFGDSRQRYNARTLVAEFFGVTEYEIRKAIKLTQLIPELADILENSPKQLNLPCAELMADYDAESQRAFIEMCTIGGYQINKATVRHIVSKCPPPAARKQAIFNAWHEARAAADEKLSAPPKKISFDRKRFAPYLDKLGSNQKLEDLFLEFLRERVGT